MSELDSAQSSVSAEWRSYGRVHAAPVVYEDGTEWRAWHADGHGPEEDVKAVAFTVRGREPMRELFIVAPNSEDMRYAHPSQTVWLGYGERACGVPWGSLGVSRGRSRFGRQWMFTPPPLVFPFRSGQLWGGAAVGAPAGANLFSSATYGPVDEQTYEVVVDYEPPRNGRDTRPTLLVTRACTYRSPFEVIAAYAEELRRRGWAPRPTREPADWWYDTLLCTWGEQCNLRNQALSNPRKDLSEHPVVAYETQANQTRWIRHLVDQGIPVGVVSTSDKWQRDRYRLVPDEGRYDDLRGFAKWNHQAGRHIIAWWGLWGIDGAPAEWCIRDGEGRPRAVDPENAEYRRVIEEDVTRLLSPSGYDLDGFFLDFTANQPWLSVKSTGERAGIELLHDYVSTIYGAAKAAKPDAMVMTHCPHPYFADVTDVLRLNDWAVKTPNIIEQASYRRQIVASCSDWLINTDNWPMYDRGQWREYLDYQPEIGIPASWFAWGVFGEGSGRYEAFEREDYDHWRDIWLTYRKQRGLPAL